MNLGNQYGKAFRIEAGISVLKSIFYTAGFVYNADFRTENTQTLMRKNVAPGRLVVGHVACCVDKLYMGLANYGRSSVGLVAG